MSDLDTPRRMAPVPAGSVQSGDVLLMRGRSQLSTMIAWVCDSIYSHSAVMADDGNLYESITHGILSTPLGPRLGPDSPVYMVDAFRPVDRDGAPLAPGDRALVVAHGTQLLGLPYATSDLAMIALVVALRGKLFPHAPMGVRWVLREAFDSVLRDDSDKMTCSEFVYRCFDQNAAVPAGRLAPEIVPVRPPDPPTPYAGNIVALVREVWELLHPQRKAALLQAGEVAGAAAPDFAAASPVEVSDEDLAAKAAAIRARFGAGAAAGGHDGRLASGKAADAMAGPPNPKGVSPADLAVSPSHRYLGRLMQAPDWQGD